MAAVDTSVTSSDAASAGGLRWELKDPFDRMIVAQAIRHGRVIVIATSDARILAATLTPLLDTRRKAL